MTTDRSSTLRFTSKCEFMSFLLSLLFIRESRALGVSVKAVCKSVIGVVGCELWVSQAARRGSAWLPSRVRWTSMPSISLTVQTQKVWKGLRASSQGTTSILEGPCTPAFFRPWYVAYCGRNGQPRSPIDNATPPPLKDTVLKRQVRAGRYHD